MDQRLIAMHDEPRHVAVLLDQVVRMLDPAPGDVVLDCTAGLAGHGVVLADHVKPDGVYIGIETDPQNVRLARSRLEGLPIRIEIVHANFADAPAILQRSGVAGVDVLLADLGFSSAQMDDPERGLSFTHNGPLDMRLDPTQDLTAADVVNRLPQRELADLIFRFGQERYSRRIARKIVDIRETTPIKTTALLARLCAEAYGPARHRQRIDPATRTFQALRIAVNDELDNLERLLEQMPRLLKNRARAAVISFHSLEDRMVKQTFRRFTTEGRAESMTKKPLRADESEVAVNRRSRSAKLRAIRWLGAEAQVQSIS